MPCILYAITAHMLQAFSERFHWFILNHPARASTVHSALFARIAHGKAAFLHGARRRDARLHREGRGFDTLSAHQRRQ